MAQFQAPIIYSDNMGDQHENAFQNNCRCRSVEAVPSLCWADSNADFLTKKAGAVSLHPGLWFTIKNTCTGAAFATVGDKICQLQIGSATFMTKVRQGDVPAGFSEQFNICAAKAGGDGQVLFIPPPASPVTAELVTVKPGSTVSIPAKFCR